MRKAKSNGAFIIAIDPRVTGTTKIADLHLQIKPGADTALVNGMLRIILEEGYDDHRFIAEHTTGWEELLAYLKTVRHS
nr:molybdopterin-dependent oxidoreductase [Aneurinibacillus terranovensis]